LEREEVEYEGLEIMCSVGINGPGIGEGGVRIPRGGGFPLRGCEEGENERFVGEKKIKSERCAYFF